MTMDLSSLHRQAVTFCALAVLFLGSFFYFISTAFDNVAALEERRLTQGYPDDL